ncbi:MAG: BadF/BadG/BcrA/BcrD ATPase family protein [Pseudomonadota bacterium]
MGEPHTIPVLAIDGGGTRCRIGTTDGDGIVSVEVGSANVSTDFDGSLREIVSGLDLLGRRIGRSGEALCQRPAFVGLAGVTGPEMAQQVQTALPLRRVRVDDDRPAAVRGALGARDGVVAQCGTGSFFAAQIDGRQRLAGGWGPVLGDEASAHWVGRLALSRTLDCVDTTRSGSALTDSLLAEFGGAPGIVRFAGAAAPAEIGRLAQAVTRGAREGDPVALDILRLGAAWCADMVRRLGWSPGRIICLTGGIGPEYADHLPEEMRACLAPPEGSTLDGAIALAVALADEAAP